MRGSFCHPTFIGVTAGVDVHGRGAGEPRIVIMLTITSALLAALHSRLQLEYKPSRFMVHFLTLFLGIGLLTESVLPRLDTTHENNTQVVARFHSITASRRITPHCSRSYEPLTRCD